MTFSNDGQRFDKNLPAARILVPSDWQLTSRG